VVAFSHFSNKTYLFNRLFGDAAGQLGVMLFYCLSGYLMASLYLHTPVSKAAVGEFARRRFARIGPLYLVVFVISAAWRAINGTPWPLYNVHLGDLIGVTEPDGVLWTIPIEVQFYLIFPLLWAFFQRSSLAFTIVVAGMLVGTEVFLASSDVVRPFFALFFLAGILAALMPPLPKGTMNGVFLISLIAFVLGCPRVMSALGLVSLPKTNLSEFPWRLPSHLAIMPVLVWSARYSGIADRLLGNKLAAGFGDISYSVYILHFPILVVLSTSAVLMNNHAIFFLVFAILTVVMATLSFRYIERPARSAINRASWPAFLGGRFAASTTAAAEFSGSDAVRRW
jgi:peptidoglycan/LPS O-acetylase OafA/YrhL